MKLSEDQKKIAKAIYPDDPSEFHLTTQDFLYFVAEHYDSPISVSAL